VKRAAWGVALGLACLEAGCQAERSAGTSTETENAIASRTFLVDSLLSPDCPPTDAPEVVTLRLDSGDFAFAKSRPDGADLDVLGPDGREIPFAIGFWDPASAKARLLVRIEAASRRPGARIELRSGLTPAKRSSPEAVWAGIPLDRKLSWNSALVDDFETGTTLHNRLPDSSFWFLGGTLAGSGLVAADSGRAGSSLHLTCNAGQCATDRGLLAATLLANSYRSLRPLDSLEFWARGNGRIWISFESLDSVQMGRLVRGRIDSVQPRRAWTSRTLDASWRRWTVRPVDFDPADGVSGNVGWSAVRDSLNYLTILVDRGTEIWIDDIRLHGILRDDLR